MKIVYCRNAPNKAPKDLLLISYFLDTYNLIVFVRLR